MILKVIPARPLNSPQHPDVLRGRISDWDAQDAEGPRPRSRLGSSRIQLPPIFGVELFGSLIESRNRYVWERSPVSSPTVPSTAEATTDLVPKCRIHTDLNPSRNGDSTSFQEEIFPQIQPKLLWPNSSATTARSQPPGAVGTFGMHIPAVSRLQQDRRFPRRFGNSLSGAQALSGPVSIFPDPEFPLPATLNHSKSREYEAR
ncbi:hypothetical protein DUI87_29742 [Hirundo rustica rustica]|uniref:Uncharacterized protein n=1 Tax=Hirundo rustica rustica TaxID=333673 RepID=A0A3M0IYG9_HIRRU|nr:hypothetical protein DUI87_29742 [Hirundo rustica rustica]